MTAIRTSGAGGAPDSAVARPGVVAAVRADLQAARRCWPWLRAEHGLLRRSVLAGLLAQFGAVAAAVGGSALAGAVLGGASGPFPWWLVGSTGAAVLVTGAATWWEMVLSHDLAYRVLAGLRVTVFDRLRLLVPSRRPAWRSGEFTATALSDVESLEWLLAHVLGQVVVTGVLIGAGAVLAGWLAPPVLLVLGPAAVLLLTVPWWRRALADRQGADERLASATLQADVVETLDGLADLTAAGALPRRQELIARRTRELLGVHRRTAVRAGGEAAAVDAITALAAVLALLLVTGRVVDGQLPVAVAPIVLTLVGAVLLPAAQLARTLHRAGALRASVHRIEQVLSAPPAVPPVDLPAGPAAGDRTAAPALELAGVRFGYRPADPVLHEVDLRVERGEIVALAGASGAGKSTVLALVQRFWDPDAGQIRVQGRPLPSIPDDELRGLITVVPQDVHLFAGTLAENLRLGRPDATDEQLWRAVEDAQLGPTVRRLPRGLDTPIGEHGATLSGGERARVAIARALLVRAPVLLLDEAVANLDAATELDLHRALDRTRAGRATLVVAHRASTIARADRVVVLDRGRVVQVGPPVQTSGDRATRPC
ncbi:ABC transporter ATP-binding protein [Nakamurella sp.]|uniref:ABC transporter ATP-binding protein n=1 Tax=Nakamurella sp. TaxID=1869182 RepID=UPI003B3AA87C